MFKKLQIIKLIKSFFNVWSILKLIVIVICFSWFYLFGGQIIKKYFKYKTVVMVEYKQPNETQLPAVTLCAYSFIDDESLSSDYWQEWDNSTNSTPAQRYNMRERIRTMALQDMTAEDIFNDTSFTLDKLVSKCHFYPKNPKIMMKNERANKGIPCNRITTPIQSIYQGRKCFTLFSHLNISESRSINMKFEMRPYIRIIFADQSDPYNQDHLPNETLTFSIHAPNIIPTHRDASFYRISFAKLQYYDLRFRKDVQYLKPPPYTTKCRWYNKDDPPGERSRGDCLNHCIKWQTFDKCFNFNSVVTKDLVTRHNHKFCTEDESNLKVYAAARSKCKDQCQLTCYEEEIEVPFAKLPRTDDIRESYLIIRSSTTVYSFMYHRDDMETFDFIANLGAHAHIWLGLSALKIFHWIVQLIHYIKRYLSK